MAEARNLAEWDRTAYLAATILNVLRTKGASPVDPATLNPYRRKQHNDGIDLDEAGGMAALRERFVKTRNREGAQP